MAPAAPLVPPLERVRRQLVRLWPHLCGFVLAGFWSLAERESWHQSLERPYTATLTGWWQSRATAPLALLDHDPQLAWTLILILSPLILLHLLLPRWYLAPFSLMATFGWFLWGTVALGRMGVQAVG